MEEKIYLGLHHIHLRKNNWTSKKTNELYFLTEAVYTGIMIRMQQFRCLCYATTRLRPHPIGKNWNLSHYPTNQVENYRNFKEIKDWKQENRILKTRN